MLGDLHREAAPTARSERPSSSSRSSRREATERERDDLTTAGDSSLAARAQPSDDRDPLRGSDTPSLADAPSETATD